MNKDRPVEKDHFPTESQDTVTDAEYQVLADFRRTLRRFLHFSEAAASGAGLTPQQYQALLAIRGAPDPGQVTVGALAETLHIQHHSAVGLVDRLVSQQLVERRQSTSDRRNVYVALAPSGLETLARLSVVHKAELRQLSPQIIRLMQSLRGGLPPNSAKKPPRSPRN